jgi:hypothetical protein
MANQFASISSAVSILKNFYQGPIVSQFNDEIPFYREIEKGKEKFSGQQVVRPVKVRRNPGIGATSDGGVLPKIGQQTTQQAQIAAKYNYLRFGITGPMIKASQGDKGAFASAMEFEMEQGMVDLKNDVNRQIFWDGTSDLAVLSANATNSNVITVTGRESAEDGSKYLDVGIVIDIYTAAGAVVASGLTINALTGTTTATLTLDSPVTASATDVVVRTGTFGQEVQGILYTLDGLTSTIYNIDRSAYPTYQGNVISANNGQLTLNLMQQAYNEARRRGGGKTNLVYSDFDSERFYNKLLVSDKRYQAKVTGDGTFSSKDGSYLEFAGNPIVPDKDSPQRFFFLDSSTFKKYVLSELEWADETGSPMIAQSGADAFEIRLRLFMNLFCEKPSANSVLKSYISP